MTIVGLLDADLQEATEYRAGGIGPLFAQVRVEERFPIHEFLNRALRACRAARVTTVLNLFVDEIEVYRAGEDEVDNLERVLKLARDESIPAESTSFVLMLLHEDDNLVHVISVEASTDAWEAEADVADYADEPDQAEDDAAAKDLVRTFLERLLGELTRELSLSEPELDVWIDREGRYDFQLMYADTLPPDAGPPQ
jgi:hypothetical protein